MTTNAARSARRSSHGAPLPAAFFERDTEQVARDLLGAVLECRIGGLTRGRIVETEAYLGEHDPACHAAAGRTERTRWLYGAPGTAYVYFIYGMHWCFNAVTRRVDEPSAVLVRGLEPLDGLALMRRRRDHPRDDRQLANGPAKLCEAMAITAAINGRTLARAPVLIRRGTPLPDDAVEVTTRIGITRAADWPLRFAVADNPFVSAMPRSPRSGGRHRRSP